MKKKIKVLGIIDTYRVGGAGRVLLQFLGNADRTRFDYILGTFKYRNPPSREFIEAAQQKGLRLTFFSQRFFLDPAPFHEAWKTIQREKINLLETHGYKGHLIAWVLRWLTGVKWVGVSHGWTEENRKMRLYNWIDRFLLKRADLVIAVSPVLQQTLQRLRGSKPTALVLNAVDEMDIVGEGKAEEIRNRCRVTPNTKIIGVFGRLSPEKGHRFLLQGIADFLTSKDLAVLIVGEGPLERDLKQQVMMLGMANRVHFEGQRSNMRDYYEAIDMLVLPSLSEGLPLVILEAMAMGKPVVATDVGAINEVIEDGVNGWLVEPGDSERLTRRLLELIGCPDEIKRIAEKGKQSLYPKFHPDRQCAEVLSLYAYLLDLKGDDHA